MVSALSDVLYKRLRNTLTYLLTYIKSFKKSMLHFVSLTFCYLQHVFCFTFPLQLV